MPRILTLQLNEFKVPVTLRVLSRETLYGTGSREKKGENNELLVNALLTRDGAHILPYSGIGANYVDPEGNYLEDTLLIDAEGRALPVMRSMFKEPVKLTRTLSLKELFFCNIERTYILHSEDIEGLTRLYTLSKKLLDQEKFYRFSYAYYDTTNPREAVLIPKNGHLFVLIGDYADLIMMSPTEIFYADIEEEELEEELTFEVW